MILEIPVNLDRLYDASDPAYVVWLTALCTRVSDTRKAIAQEQERRMNAARSK